ncbi:hypothetical protein HYY75_07580 [bacterium]|nr:hypothetical protein [bacterium]
MKILESILGFWGNESQIYYHWLKNVLSGFIILRRFSQVFERLWTKYGGRGGVNS